MLTKWTGVLFLCVNGKKSYDKIKNNWMENLIHF